jgi:hypothetical protein
LLPAFAFFAPDLVVPDFLEPGFELPRELDFDLPPELELEPELDFDLLPEREPGFDLLPEPELDFDLLPERESGFDLDSESGFDLDSDSVGGFGGRVTGSMCLLRSVLVSSGGGSPWALKIPITSGAAPCPEARWPLVSSSRPSAACSIAEPDATA